MRQVPWAGGALVNGAADVGNQGLDAGDLIINGVSVGAISGSATLTTQVANAVTAINAVSDQSGVKAYGTGNRISFYSETGGAINIKSADTDARLATVVTAIGLATGDSS
jgi:flagellin